MAGHGQAQAVGSPFFRIFGRVDAEDGEPARSQFKVELPQLRQDIQAVDSAVRPKVEQDETTAQVGKPHGPVDAKPCHVAWKLGRSNHIAAPLPRLFTIRLGPVGSGRITYRNRRLAKRNAEELNMVVMDGQAVHDGP